MTKIVCISDTHTQRIKDMPEGDILIHSGDYSGRGSLTHLSEFIDWLEILQDKYKDIIVISGNHDFNGEKEPQITKEMFDSAGIIYLNDSSVTLQGFKIHGSPISPYFHNWAFNRFEGPEIQDHWNLIPSDVNILVTHCPPWGIGDELSKYGSEPGKNVGSYDLLETIKSRLKDLKLHVFGHIHEGYGKYTHPEIPGVNFVNASSLNEHYQQRNKPIEIQL